MTQQQGAGKVVHGYHKHAIPVLIGLAVPDDFGSASDLLHARSALLAEIRDLRTASGSDEPEEYHTPIYLICPLASRGGIRLIRTLQNLKPTHPCRPEKVIFPVPADGTTPAPPGNVDDAVVSVIQANTDCATYTARHCHLLFAIVPGDGVDYLTQHYAHPQDDARDSRPSGCEPLNQVDAALSISHTLYAQQPSQVRPPDTDLVVVYTQGDPDRPPLELSPSTRVNNKLLLESPRHYFWSASKATGGNGPLGEFLKQMLLKKCATHQARAYWGKILRNLIHGADHDKNAPGRQREEFQQIVRQFERFNAELHPPLATRNKLLVIFHTLRQRRRKELLRNKMAEARDYLLNERDGAWGELIADSAMGAPRREALQEILYRYEYADALAGIYARRTYDRIGKMFVLGGMAVLSIELYAHMGQNLSYWLASCFFFLGTVLLYLQSYRRKSHEKYVEYRALAESLRVQFFWACASLTESASDHYPHTLVTELGWVRSALRGTLIASQLPHTTADTAQLPAERHLQRLGFIKQRWIKDQLNFFHGKQHLHGDIHYFYTAISKWFFAAAIATLLGMMGYQLIASELGWAAKATLSKAEQTSLKTHDHHDVHHLHELHEQHLYLEYIITAYFVLLLISGLLHAFDEKKAYHIIAHRYEWMSALYAQALQVTENIEMRLENSTTDPAHGDPIEEWHRELCSLGQEALTENGNWVLVNRNRPIELPRA